MIASGPASAYQVYVKCMSTALRQRADSEIAFGRWKNITDIIPHLDDIGGCPHGVSYRQIILLRLQRILQVTRNPLGVNLANLWTISTTRRRYSNSVVCVFDNLVRLCAHLAHFVLHILPCIST